MATFLPRGLLCWSSTRSVVAMPRVRGLTRPFGCSPMKPYEFVQTCPPPTVDTGCTYCEPKYPLLKPIKKDAKLAGTAPVLNRQLLVSTGHSGWPSKTEKDASSFEALVRNCQLAGVARDPDYNFMVTSTTLAPDTAQTDAWSIYLYPDNLYFPSVPYSLGEAFVKRYLIPSRHDEAAGLEDKLEIRPTTNPIIAICGHASRDVRCGIVAPLLQDEFERVLAMKGMLYDATTGKGIKVAICSHVGGHVYAGNVLYFDEDGTSVWYGLVKPEHVQGIVAETVEQKRIVYALYRGGTVAAPLELA
ncbi:Sucrase/ferredoxin-like-domain-containing protein [Limtongia smithiae]|uniref:Sucrase/ferredoxin-like-domain-containing protein n=1 Tax=Limtongia smithiae TaxID=1125753 RepID=UPI0034CEEDA9